MEKETVIDCIEFSYKCPMKWDDLLKTDNDDIKFCEQCQHNVYYARNKKEIDYHNNKKHCVAILIKIPDGVTKSAEYQLGTGPDPKDNYLDET